ncbi:GPI inositol deacylase [Microbotryomycetes sp. JL221]|nr:GPI inositol deacylase [Microbotryomycetes sp. JL221]
MAVGDTAASGHHHQHYEEQTSNDVMMATPAASTSKTATGDMKGWGSRSATSVTRIVWLPRLSSTLVAWAAASFVALVCVYLSYVDTQPVYPPASLASDARGGGAGSCRMSYMSPSYLHLSGFGTEYTRLGAGPWGVYLYREVGWDDDPLARHRQREPNSPRQDDSALHLTGTPVVFVPGNAGSFRQVRSLASAASRAWFEVPGFRRKGISSREGAKSLDFFTIDYNDDFSAFHGQTLLDQAEYLADTIRYILSLYHQRDNVGRPDPTSVIVVAHSMGGIVARAALLHPNYQSGSISTLLTIATPHIVPPVTVDSGVDKVYNSINALWRDAYGLSASTSSTSSSSQLARARAELADLVLVSVSGGVSDVTIASESASLSSILPPNDSHGFTVFTTAIPTVQTPIDHLAILWCQQLMQVVAHAMLSIVDVRNPSGVVPRQERIDKLSEKLLGALESRPKSIEGRQLELAVLERGEAARNLKRGERLVVRQEDHATKRVVYLLPVPTTMTYGSTKVFSLLTSASIGRAKEQLVEVYACGPSGANTQAATSRESAEKSPLCWALFPTHVTPVPVSRHAAVSPILPAPVEDGTMGFVNIDTTQLEDMTSIAIVVKPGQRWILAEFSDKDKRVETVAKSAWQLMLSGYKLPSFPSTPSLVSEIWLPALDSSLLTYKLQVFRSDCHDSPASSLFAPLVRQFSPLLHESKYFPNVRRASLYTHSSGPYLPPPASPFASTGSRLQLFLDPTCSHDSATSASVAIEIKLDLWTTLGNLVMRYRIAAVSFPFAIIILVFSRQLTAYNAGDPFMPFGTALSFFARQAFVPMLGIVTLVSLIQAVLLSTHLSIKQALHAASIDDMTSSAARTSSPSSWLANMLLGNQSTFFAGTAAFVLFSMLSVVLFEYLALHCLVAGMAAIVRFLHSRGPRAWRKALTVCEPRDSLPTQRIVTMGALLLIVLVFAPYQFAFLVIFLVHLFSTVRALLLAQDASSPTTPASSRRLWDRYHYSFANLLIMMALLPINALILVVWVRNLAVGWLAPFSTDHNVFNILGFLLNVEALHSGKMLGRTPTGLPFAISVALPVITAGFSLLWGIRYAHNIFPLANVLSLWLAANNSQALVGAVHDAVLGKRRSSLVPPSSQVVSRALGGGHSANGDGGTNAGIAPRMAIDTNVAGVVRKDASSPSPGGGVGRRTL